MRKSEISLMGDLIMLVLHAYPEMDIDQLIDGDPDGLTALAELAEKGMIEPKGGS